MNPPISSVSVEELSSAPANRMAVTITLMSAIVMQALDTTVVNVSLPHMEASLNATQDQISWVLTSYIVAAAVTTPAIGWIAARFGRTQLLITSLIGFTAVSLLCGVAQSLPQMVLFRILQGAFGAALMPLSQAIMLDTHSPAELGRAMSVWGMGTMIGPIMGPTIGGFLTDEYNWRWCFYVNLPVGLLTILGAIAFVPKSKPAADKRFDWLGFGFLVLALASLQLALDRGEQKGWLQSTEIQIEAALTALGLYLFVVDSATTKRPFVDPVLFRDRYFVLSMLIVVAITMVFNGVMVLVPQLLQTEFNYPVLTTGLLMAPRGFGTIAAMLLYGRLSNRLDPRPPIIVGLLIVGWAMYTYSKWSLTVGVSQIITVTVVQGLGMGLLFAPLTTIAFGSLPTRVRTEAAGLFALMRNMGGSIGISIVFSQLTQFMQRNHAYLAAHMTPFRHVPGSAASNGTAAMEMLNLDLNHQAGMVAYINVFRLLAALSTLGIPLVLLMPALRSPASKESNDPAMLAQH